MSTKTATKKLYIHDDGSILCTDHAGHELSGAIKNNPRRKTHWTPRGTWEIATSDYYEYFKSGTGIDLDCEICRDWNFT
jgi:hypothetical protein